MPAFFPSAVAQAVATAAANNMAALANAVTSWQTAIAGGSLTLAALFDGLRTGTTFTEVQGGIGFANGWVNFGGANETAGYCKDAFGFVHLRGCIQGTPGTTVIPSNAFQLPVGFRPRALIAIAVNSNNAFGSVGIDVNGNVNISVGNIGFVFIDGIHFFAG